MLECLDRRRFNLGMLTAAAAGLFPSSGQAQEDFYKGKQMTIIVGYGTGGGYDVYARLLARHMGRFLPGNPSLVVQNMPGAGSLRALNHLYNVAPKDGTVIAMFSSSMPVQSILGGNPSVNFDSRKLTWLGSSSSFENDAYLLVIRTENVTGSSIADLRRKDGSPIVLGSSGPGSSSYDIPVVLRDTIGLTYKMVSGYPDSAALFLAMERGEIDGRMVNLTGIMAIKPDWLKPGNGYRAVVQFGRSTRIGDLKDVPIARELAINPSALELIKLVEAPFVLSRPFAAPPGVPADRARTLEAAFMSVHRDPQFVAEAEKSSLDVSPIGSAPIVEILEEIAKADAKNLSYLRDLYASAKN